MKDKEWFIRIRAYKTFLGWKYDVWIMEKDGPCNSGIMYGEMLTKERMKKVISFFPKMRIEKEIQPCLKIDRN